MRQILRLLCGGNKHNLFLILPSPSHWTNLLGQKEGDGCMKDFGDNIFLQQQDYYYYYTHHSASTPPLAGRWPRVGTTWALWSLMVSANSRWDPALPAAGKPSSLKKPCQDSSHLSLVFLNLASPCWWSARDGKRTGRGVSEIISVLSEACWWAQRMGKGKSKDKSSKFSLVGTWLQTKSIWQQFIGWSFGLIFFPPKTGGATTKKGCGKTRRKTKLCSQAPFWL